MPPDCITARRGGHIVQRAVLLCRALPLLGDTERGQETLLRSVSVGGGGTGICLAIVPINGSLSSPPVISAAAAGCGDNDAGLAEARVAVETNGRIDGDLKGGDGPARGSNSPHANKARGDDDGKRVQQESTAADAPLARPLSRDNLGLAAVAATGGTREPQTTERLRRRVGEGDDRLPAQRGGGCYRELSPSARGGSTSGGGVFEGLRVAGVATLAAVVMLSIAVALASGDHHVRAEGVPEIAGGGGGGVGEGSDHTWRLAGAWPGVSILLMLFSASVALVAALAVAAGCLWCAIRVARWREEIFAGSPVVTEVFSRAAALDRDRSKEEHSRPSADESGCAGSGRGSGSGSGGSRNPVTSNCGGNNVVDDPVGNIFRPGTRASHDFYAPCLVTETASTGGDRSSATAVSNTEPAAVTTAGDANGAVVFLTGVTGLVGQMVLFDLLRQGAAAARLTSAGDDFGDDDDTKEERSAGPLASRGLRRVVVLVRGKKCVCPADRLASIRDSPMFRPLRESGAWVDGGETSTAAGAEELPEVPLPSSSSRTANAPGLGLRRKRGRRVGTVVTAVEGELGKEGLGLTVEARALLAGAGVTHALHCAASVSFSDPLAEAAATNVTGALRVAALVASWPSCG